MVVNCLLCTTAHEVPIVGGMIKLSAIFGGEPLAPKQRRAIEETQVMVLQKHKLELEKRIELAKKASTNIRGIREACKLVN